MVLISPKEPQGRPRQVLSKSEVFVPQPSNPTAPMQAPKPSNCPIISAASSMTLMPCSSRGLFTKSETNTQNAQKGATQLTMSAMPKRILYSHKSNGFISNSGNQKLLATGNCKKLTSDVLGGCSHFTNPPNHVSLAKASTGL